MTANSPRSATWAIPSNHTLSAAATVDQAGARFAFANWSTGSTSPTLVVSDFGGTPTTFMWSRPTSSA